MITRRIGRRTLPAVGAALLGCAAAIHVLWGTGSAWPARDRQDLADLVTGTEEFPGAAACITVAGLLAGAAALVASGAGGRPGVAARVAIAAGLAVRGVAGTVGATRVLVPWTPSDRFVRQDRRYYGPLCLLIAALVAAGQPTLSLPSSRAED